MNLYLRINYVEKSSRKCLNVLIYKSRYIFHLFHNCCKIESSKMIFRIKIIKCIY